MLGGKRGGVDSVRNLGHIYSVELDNEQIRHVLNTVEYNISNVISWNSEIEMNWKYIVLWLFMYINLKLLNSGTDHA